MSFCSAACYDFNGRPLNTLPIAPVNISDQPLLNCNCGQEAVIPDLFVNANVGTAQYVNNQVNLFGRGGVFNTAIGVDTIDNADYRNYTPYTVGVEGKTLNGNDPSEFDNIQQAINAAVASGATNNNKRLVYIKGGSAQAPSVYVQNIELHPGVVLVSEQLFGVVIQGSVTIASGFPQSGNTFIMSGLIFRQIQGSPLMLLPSVGTGSRVTYLFDRCQLIQTDVINSIVAIQLPTSNIADIITFAVLNGGISSSTVSSPAAPTLQSTGTGRLGLNLFSTQVGNGTWVDIQSTSAGGSFLYDTNQIRCFACVISESYFTCGALAVNTVCQFQSCSVTNDSTIATPLSYGGFIAANAGVWMILGCHIQNGWKMGFDGAQTECWAIGNVLTEDDALPPAPQCIFNILNGATLFAHSNIIDHTHANWAEGDTTGVYRQYQTIAPLGSNIIRSGTNTTNGIIVLPATVG